MTKYFIFDTNVLVSATLLENSVNRLAIKKVAAHGLIALSDDTMNEFLQVISRKKFDKYFFDDNERLRLFDEIEFFSKKFSPTETITACSDPKDNKFLELAVAADAVCIITGDADLLALHPFRNIPILNAVDFLNYDF